MISAVVAIVVAATAVYFYWSPEDNIFFPKCVFKVLTGYDCPGCGSQRAFHALLHGHPLDALSYNFFMIVGIPYLLLSLYASFIPTRAGRWISLNLFSTRATLVYIFLWTAWGIGRNIWGL